MSQVSTQLKVFICYPQLSSTMNRMARVF